MGRRSRRNTLVGHAVEEGPGADLVQEGVDIRIHEEIDREDLLLGQALETPCRHLHRRAEDVGPARGNHPEQIGSDEPTGPEDEDRPLKSLDLLRNVHRHLSNEAVTLAASRPHSRRWNSCEPYRPER